MFITCNTVHSNKANLDLHSKSARSFSTERTSLHVLVPFPTCFLVRICPCPFLFLGILALGMGENEVNQ